MGEMKAADVADHIPLVVDLDGTLIRSDLLVESAFCHFSRHPLRTIEIAKAAISGKAALKAAIASSIELDVSCLPYDEDVLGLIRQARAEGRTVYLASASNERYVRAVAEHLGLFDGWFGSNATENLAAAVKAQRLVNAFGQRGFDYIGNDRADLPAWECARQCVAVRVSPKVRTLLSAMASAATFLEPAPGGARAWIKLLRVHQWAKNGLVFIALLAGHRFEFATIMAALAAFVAFSLAASGIYIVNDIVDLEADRKHPTKKRRPLAAGTVPIVKAMVVAPLLVFGALAIAFCVTPWLAAVILGYVALTTAYTFVLKRKMMVDVVALACLYTVRVIGGAVAIATPASEWLLAFSMFIFTALALMKRYVELAARLDSDLPDPQNRNYRKTDIDIVAALAAAAGFNAVTVFALYISSDTSHQLYSHPMLLWLICPILMYWLGRA